MSREWSQFYLAMGMMALTVALFANIAHDESINLGPLSTWFAAFATLGAVTVALFNTDRTIRDAIRREHEADIRSAERFLKSIQSLAFRLKTSLKIYWEEDKDNDWADKDLDFLENRLRLDELIGILSRMPLHQARDMKTIMKAELLLFAAHTAAHALNECRADIKQRRTKAGKLDLSAQLSSCEDIEDDAH